MTATTGIGLAATVSFKTTDARFAAVLVKEAGYQGILVRPVPDEASTSHEVVVMGLHPDTDYSFTPQSWDLDGSPEVGSPVSYRTPTLPPELPAFEVTVSSSDVMQEGITLFSLNLVDLKDPGRTASGFPPVLVGVDSTGDPVWYSRLAGAESPLMGFTLLNGEDLLVLGQSTVTEILGMGKKFGDHDVKQMGFNASFLHHDADRLASGNLLSLATSAHPIDAQHGHSDALIFDSVVEFDLDGSVARRWNLADLIPYDGIDIRSMGENWNFFYPEYSETFDVYHANSLAYDSSDDSVVVGLHSWGWLVKISLETGRLVWAMGDGGSLQLEGGEPWFHATHGPDLLPDGHILVYDNGSFGSTGFRKSRVIEYEVPSQGPVRQVWDYPPDFYSPFMGNVQRMNNGNTLLCNGARITGDSSFVMQPSVTEVSGSKGNPVVFNLELEPLPLTMTGLVFVIYRAYRIPVPEDWYRRIPE